MPSSHFLAGALLVYEQEQRACPIPSMEQLSAFSQLRTLPSKQGLRTLGQCRHLSWKDFPRKRH